MLHHRPRVRPFGCFVLRTPLLALDELSRWSEGLEAAHEAAGADASAVAGALARDRARLRRRLGELIARPEVREGLFLASPSLAAHLDEWRAAPDGKRGRKIERALVRYVQRMAARATPFGLFGGCTLGELGAVTRLALAPRAASRRHTRLDMDYVAALSAALAADPALRDVLLHGPNTSLYRAAGQLRYLAGYHEADAEGRGVAGGRSRSYRLVAVEPSDYLEAVLAHGREGRRPGELAAALADSDPDIAPEDAAWFVNALIERQILVSELEPAVTGPEPVQGLVDALGRAPEAAAGARQAASVLAEVQAELTALDRDGLGVDPGRYRAIAGKLATLPVAPALARLFQVDLVKPASAAVLSHELAIEIGRAVEVLCRLEPAGDHALDRFRDQLRARYQDREVPLMAALDEESGIGFDSGQAPGAAASPLLAGLDFAAAPGGEATAASAPEAWRALVQRKLVETLRAGAAEMSLEEADLADLQRLDPAPLPPAVAVVAVVAAASEQALARGDVRVHVRGARGPSGAEILARFCHADPGIEEAVRALVAAEEAHDPEAIHAEIVHLPEDRLGNVLLRPVLRGYEIPYLGRSGAPRERQIGVDDLLVSVAGGRVVLHSRRLGREILPRLTTAHRAREGLGVYRFLCALARQGAATTLRWRWGPLEDAPYLPRVVCGRLVLELARWRLLAGDLEPLSRAWASASEARLFAAARALRQRLGLPRRVALVEGDNLLPVDLDNILSIEAFAQLARGRDRVQLVESFPGPEELCVRGPEGRFVHELIVPFVRERAERAVPGARSRVGRSRPDPGASRTFPPGSAWLYAKIYSGPATADRVLRAAIAPVIASARADGLMDRWFFVRYADPDLHLRLRFHGEPGQLLGELMPRLSQALAPLLADERVWRVQLDTYEREVERYGGEEGVLLAEQIFAADSGAVLAMMELLSAQLGGDAAADARWRLGLRSVDHLLEDLGLDVAERHEVVARARASLGRRLGAGVSLERQLGARYRHERGALEALLAPEGLDGGQAGEHPLAMALEVLRRRSARIAPAVAALRQAAAAGRLSASMPALAGHHVHLHLNRLLRAPALQQELVLYDFLARLYRSRMVRGTNR